MAYPGSRTAAYDRGECLATHEPQNGNTKTENCPNRILAVEAQAVPDAGNPTITLGTYDRGDVKSVLVSQRPSGPSGQA